MPTEPSTVSNPFQPWRRNRSVIASNPARLDVTPDSEQHSEQRTLLEAIAQFVVLADRLQDFIDHYWDLDHFSARLFRDPSGENFSEVRPKLDLTIRDLDRVASSLVNDLGHSPDDADKVNEYLNELRRLSKAVLTSADMQSDANDTGLAQTMRKIHDIADLARVRAIAAYHDVNTATQQRLTILNLSFPENDGKRGTDPVVQLPTNPSASAAASIRTGGPSQVSVQQHTRGISDD